MKQSNAELLEKRARLDREARERIEQAHQERAAREAEILERQQAAKGEQKETPEEAAGE